MENEIKEIILEKKESKKIKPHNTKTSKILTTLDFKLPYIKRNEKTRIVHKSDKNLRNENLLMQPLSTRINYLNDIIPEKTERERRTNTEKSNKSNKSNISQKLEKITRTSYLLRKNTNNKALMEKFYENLFPSKYYIDIIYQFLYNYLTYLLNLFIFYIDFIKIIQRQKRSTIENHFIATHIKTLNKIMVLLQNSEEAAEKLAVFLKYEHILKNNLLFKAGIYYNNIIIIIHKNIIIIIILY